MPALPGPLASLARDVSTLRDAWGSLRRGGSALWADARQLVEERAVQVQTTALAPGPGWAADTTVLRTRLRLNGDAETEVCRPWLRDAPADRVQALVAAHFASVEMAVQGWAAIRALASLVSRLAVLAGATWTLLRLGWSGWSGGVAALPEAIAAEPLLVAGLVLALAGLVLGQGLRRYARHRFRLALARWRPA